MNGWHVDVYKSQREQQALFGLARDVSATRLTQPLPKRGVWRRIADAWRGMVHGWRWGMP